MCPAEVSRNGVDHTYSLATLSIHGSVRPFWPFILLVQGVQVVDLEPLYQCTTRWFSSAAITRQTCGHSPAYSGTSVHTKSPSLYKHGPGTATAGRAFPIMTYKTKDWFECILHIAWNSLLILSQISFRTYRWYFRLLFYCKIKNIRICTARCIFCSLKRFNVLIFVLIFKNKIDNWDPIPHLFSTDGNYNINSVI